MKTCGGDASRPLALLSLIKRENSGDQFFEMSKTSKLGFWKQTALLLRAWGLPDRGGLWLWPPGRQEAPPPVTPPSTAAPRPRPRKPGEQSCGAARPLCICCPNRPLRPVSSLDVGEGWHLSTLGSRWVAGD